MTIAVWLGNAAPLRSIRWLDGALAVAAKFDGAVALCAGESAWTDLASDRATRAGLKVATIATELKLDYLGWAQIIAAVARQLKADTILVDEASRPERFAEIAAIAEQLDAAQLTRVVALAPDGAVVHATRIAGRELQTVRVQGPCVYGVRIAGPAIEDYPTPVPATGARRFELKALGLDALVLGHRAIPPRGAVQPKKTVDRIAEHLTVHLAHQGRKGT